jgi:hypothetical protein
MLALVPILLCFCTLQHFQGRQGAAGSTGTSHVRLACLENAADVLYRHCGCPWFLYQQFQLRLAYLGNASGQHHGVLPLWWMLLPLQYMYQYFQMRLACLGHAEWLDLVYKYMHIFFGKWLTQTL